MTSAGEPAPGLPRTLADVLREAGIEPVGRGGRRRRADPAQAEFDAGPEPRPDVLPSAARHADRAAPERGESGPDGVAEPALPRRHRRRKPDPEAEPERGPEPVAAVSMAGTRGRHGAVRSGTGRSATDPAVIRSGAAGHARPYEDPPAPAVVAADGRQAPRRAGLGWLLFAVELIVASVLGVLIWYAFTVLWELYPYAAAVAAPLVLTGVVLAGQQVRRWHAQEPLGMSATAGLLLVAAFLVVLPAAAVLARG